MLIFFESVIGCFILAAWFFAARDIREEGARARAAIADEAAQLSLVVETLAEKLESRASAAEAKVAAVIADANRVDAAARRTVTSPSLPRALADLNAKPAIVPTTSEAAKPSPNLDRAQTAGEQSDTAIQYGNGGQLAEEPKISDQTGTAGNASRDLFTFAPVSPKVVVAKPAQRETMPPFTAAPIVPSGAIVQKPVESEGLKNADTVDSVLGGADSASETSGKDPERAIVNSNEQTDDKYQPIFRMLAHGISDIDEISRVSGIPKGEVELLVRLRGRSII